MRVIEKQNDIVDKSSEAKITLKRARVYEHSLMSHTVTVSFFDSSRQLKFDQEKSNALNQVLALQLLI